MVFFTPLLIYVAYPDLLLLYNRLLAMLNSRIYLTEGDEVMSERTAQALRKYERRGFEFASTSAAWIPHICRSSPNCPQTDRDVLDGEGFVFRLEDMTKQELVRALCPYVLIFPTESQHLMPLRGNRLISWRLGGLPCVHGGPSMVSFTKLSPAV